MFIEHDREPGRKELREAPKILWVGEDRGAWRFGENAKGDYPRGQSDRDQTSLVESECHSTEHGSDGQSTNKNT